MAVRASRFGNGRYFVPGAYSRVDARPSAAGFLASNNLVVMGRADGGEPHTPLEFFNLSEARRALKGGPLYDAMQFAFQPGGGYAPLRVFAVRVNEGTQSTLNLLEGANPQIKLDSRDYGVRENRVKATVAVPAGATNQRSVTIEQGDIVEEFPEIERPSLIVNWVAGQTDRTLTIANTNAGVTLDISAGTGATPNATAVNVDAATMNSLRTMFELVDYLNSLAGLPDVSFTIAPGQEDYDPLNLDATSVDLDTASITLYSTFQEILDRINSGSSLVTAEAANGSQDRALPDALATTFFSGGTSGDYNAAAWQAALLAMETEDLQLLTTPDTDHDVHTLIREHCETLTGLNGRRERQFVVGGRSDQDKTTTIADAISRAQRLNSRLGVLVYNGFRQRDENGRVRDWDASYAAVAFAGIAVAKRVIDPITNKNFNALQMKERLTVSEMTRLIQNGVCPVGVNNQGVPTFIRQVTTYQVDNLLYNEFSMVQEILFASRDLRGVLEYLYVGRPNTGVTLSDIRETVIARLNFYGQNGIFVAGADGLAYSNLVIAANGDVITVEYDAFITPPVNFIFVTNHFSEQATVSAVL